MGCDIHPAVEVRRGGVWRAHRPRGECPYYYKYKWEKSAAGFERVYVLDESGERVRSEYPCCKYALPDAFHNRQYLKFAILADVRNGGFVTPIDTPRGLPHDVARGTLARLSNEHSQTWVDLQDLIDYPDWGRPLKYSDEDVASPLWREVPDLMEMIAYLKRLVPRGGTPYDVRVVMDFDS